MKTKKKVFIALLSAACLTAGALGLASCGGKDDSGKNDSRDQQIVAIYNTYVAYAEENNETVLTYDQWIKSIQGAAGTDGKNGADGATWLSGAEAPAASAGKAGDFYLNTKTLDVFLKTASGWGEAICNIKGDKGENGSAASAGKDGATWISGTEDPASVVGKEGDFYLNTETLDVFKKTAAGWGAKICNLKGATGAVGGVGATGVGIESVQLNAQNQLEITFTGLLDPADDTSDKVVLALPEALFHTHTYKESGANYYDEAIIESTNTTKGLGYKTCTATVDGAPCGHVETVVIPKRDGSQALPLLANDVLSAASGKLTIPENSTVYPFGTVYSSTYYEYTAEQDGYLFVSTYYGQYASYEDEDYGSTVLNGFACEFDVTIGSYTYDESAAKDYSESGFSGVYCEVKEGQTVAINAKYADKEYKGDSGQVQTFDPATRYLDFVFYAKGETREYVVNVVDVDKNPLQGAKVEAYTKSGDEYVKVESAAVTTGSDGVAKFNLPADDYYFTVTLEGYAPITAGSLRMSFKPVLTTTAQLENPIAVTNGMSLEVGKQYIFTVAEDDASDYNLSIDKGYLHSAIVSMFGEESECVDANGIGKYGDFTYENGTDENPKPTPSIKGISGWGMVEVVITFYVSENCTLTIKQVVSEE